MASEMCKETVNADKTNGIVEEATGNLFDAPDNAVLIREQLNLMARSRWLNSQTDACNCLGSWGAGIAKSFQNKVEFIYSLAVLFILRDYLVTFVGLLSQSLMSMTVW
jgi:hypothetical protein